MASLAKLIEELQEIERQHPGSQIFHGTQFGEAAFENYQIVQRQVSKKVWKGIRWISTKSKLTAFVIEPITRKRK